MLAKHNLKKALGVLLAAVGVWSAPNISHGQQNPDGSWTSRPVLARCLFPAINAESGGYSFEFKNTCDFQISFVYTACARGQKGGPACRMVPISIDGNQSSGDFWNFGLPPMPREFRSYE